MSAEPLRQFLEDYEKKIEQIDLQAAEVLRLTNELNTAKFIEAKLMREMAAIKEHIMAEKKLIEIHK